MLYPLTRILVGKFWFCTCTALKTCSAKHTLFLISDMNATPYLGEPHAPGNDSNYTDVQSHVNGFSPLVVYSGAIVYLSCIVIIVTGNGLVLFGLARFKILRHPSNIYVGVLSGVDLTLALSFSILTSQAIDATLFQGLLYCQFRVIILTANLLASQLLLLGMHHTQTNKMLVVCLTHCPLGNLNEILDM